MTPTTEQMPQSSPDRAEIQNRQLDNARVINAPDGKLKGLRIYEGGGQIDRLNSFLNGKSQDGLNAFAFQIPSSGEGGMEDMGGKATLGIQEKKAGGKTTYEANWYKDGQHENDLNAFTIRADTSTKDGTKSLMVQRGKNVTMVPLTDLLGNKEIVIPIDKKTGLAIVGFGNSEQIREVFGNGVPGTGTESNKQGPGRTVLLAKVDLKTGLPVFESKGFEPVRRFSRLSVPNWARNAVAAIGIAFGGGAADQATAHAPETPRSAAPFPSQGSKDILVDSRQQDTASTEQADQHDASTTADIVPPAEEPHPYAEQIKKVKETLLREDLSQQDRTAHEKILKDLEDPNFAAKNPGLKNDDAPKVDITTIRG